MVENLQKEATLRFMGSSNRRTVLKLVENRYKEVESIDILLVAGSMDPEYWDEERLFSPRGNQRFGTALNNAFNAYFSETAANDALVQWAEWRAKQHDVANDRNMVFAKNNPAFKFWHLKCFMFPTVQNLAVKLLAQVPTSSGAERINSEMGWLKVCTKVSDFEVVPLKVDLILTWLFIRFLQDPKANSLGHDNLRNFEFCHHNLRLIRKIEEVRDEEVQIL